MYFLDAAQLKPDREMILTRIPKELSSRQEIDYYINLAFEVMELQGVYCSARVKEKRYSQIKIENVWLDSRVLRVNLENAREVFPYLITCGEKFDQWYAGQNFIQKYYLDVVGSAIASMAQESMMRFIEENHAIDNTARMNPGSLPDWPLEQQKLLFTLLGEKNLLEKINVYLTKDCLMRPTKSVSGIIFPTEHDFESCKLCARENCPGRKADYDPCLEDYYK